MKGEISALRKFDDAVRKRELIGHFNALRSREQAAVSHGALLLSENEFRAIFDARWSAFDIRHSIEPEAKSSPCVPDALTVERSVDREIDNAKCLT